MAIIAPTTTDEPPERQQKQQQQQQQQQPPPAATPGDGNKRRRKNNRGRSARRRRAKLRSIREREGELLGGRGGDSETTGSSRADDVGRVGGRADAEGGGRPTDRGYVLPGVIERRRDLGTLGVFEAPGAGDDSSSCRGGEEAPPSRAEEDGGACADDVRGGRTTRRRPRDEADRIELVRQLGFVPGNAVAVAARGARSGPTRPQSGDGGDRPPRSECNPDDDGGSRIIRNDSKDVDAVDDGTGIPTVLKLYPLAVRDAYAGGKSDGRRFKSRRRGAATTKGGGSGNGDAERPKEDVACSGADDATQDPAKRDGRAGRDWRTDDGFGVIEPFPTTYWLTCPTLRARIGRLEEEGDAGASVGSGGGGNNVRAMERRLAADPDAMASMAEAHASYGRERWDLLTDEDRAEVERRQWSFSLKERGVAGISKPDKIKCLHAHAAHYLAGEGRNVVGRWVMEALARQDEEGWQKATGTVAIQERT